MAFELDHMFVAVGHDAPEVSKLVAVGFLEGERRHHVGQGTASTGIFFENAYVEFIWLEDREIANSSSIRRTHLAERTDPEQKVSPLGFALRQAAGNEEPIPFSTWDFCPPYLPTDMAIPMGDNSRNTREPLLFVLPWKSGPGYACPKHANGARAITKVLLVVEETAELSAEFAAFLALGLVEVRCGEPLLEIHLDHVRAGRLLDLRPAVPFVVRW